MARLLAAVLAGALTATAALPSPPLLHETFRLHVGSSGPASGASLELTVHAVEVPRGPNHTTTPHALELVLADVHQLDATATARVRMPPATQAEFGRPFFVLRQADGLVSEVLFSDEDAPSTVMLKKAVAASLVAPLPAPPHELHRVVSAGGAEHGAAVTWDSDEVDHTGALSALYTATGHSSAVLRVTRDTASRRYYRVDGDGTDGGHGLLHSAEFVLDAASRRGGDVGESRSARELAGHSLLGHLTSVRHEAIALVSPGAGDGAPSGEADEAAVRAAAAARAVAAAAGSVDSPVDIPAVRQRVETTLTLVSSKRASYRCSKRYLHAHPGSEGWCTVAPLGRDDGVSDNGGDAPPEVELDEERHALGSHSRRTRATAAGGTLAFRGPRGLAAALAATAPAPNDTPTPGRRLVGVPTGPLGGRAMVRETLLSDAAALAAQVASPPHARRQRRQLSASAGSSEDHDPYVGSSSLEIAFSLLRCFPAAFHDDSLPRPNAVDTNIVPCVEAATNVTDARPHVLAAMHALLLADPCDIVVLPVGEAVQVASALLEAGQLSPNPCSSRGGDHASNPYATTRMSDRVVALVISTLLATSHADVAAAAFGHMLRHPDAYRYATVLEHALTSAIFIAQPTSEVFATLMALIRGLDAMDAADAQAEATYAVSVAAATNATEGTLGADSPYDVKADGTMLLHENELKAQAVLVYTGVVSRARAAATGGGRLSVGEIQRAEAAIVSYLYTQYGAVASLNEARRALEELVSEMVIALWHVTPDDQKMRWRAQARSMRIREAESVWFASDQPFADRLQWDAQAMAAWRDQIIYEASRDPGVLAGLRVSLIHMLEAAAVGSEGSGRRLTVLAGDVDREAFSEARRLSTLASHAAVYDHDAWEAGTTTTTVILRAFGNLGSAEHLPLIMNFSYSPLLDVRLAAIDALRSLPADASVVGDAAAGRRLSVSGDRTVRSRALFAGLEAFVAPAVVTHVDASIRGLSELHEAHGVTALFGNVHASAGSASSSDPRVSVEAHLVALITASRDVHGRVRVAAAEALAQLRPLSPSCVDALLDFFEAQLAQTAAMTKDMCASDCVAHAPECRILPVSRCKADCDERCDWKRNLAAAVAQMVHDRVVRELRMLQDTSDGLGNDAALADSPMLRGAVARLTAAHRRTLRDGGRWEAPSDRTIQPALFRPRVLLHSTSDGSSPFNANGHGSRRELQGTLTARPARAMSFATLDGAPMPQQLSRARRLGVLTLLDETFGRDYRWSQSAGDINSWGAEVAVSLSNSVNIRVGVFDGVFSLNLDNQAVVRAALAGTPVNILAGKAIFVANAQYTNPIAKNLANVVAKVEKGALGLVNSVMQKVLGETRKFKTKIAPALYKIDAFATKLLNFGQQAVTIADAIVSAKSIADLTGGLRTASSQLGTQVGKFLRALDLITTFKASVNRLMSVARNSTLVKQVAYFTLSLSHIGGNVTHFNGAVRGVAGILKSQGADIATAKFAEQLAPVTDLTSVMRETLQRVEGFLGAVGNDPVGYTSRSLESFIADQLPWAVKLGLLPSGTVDSSFREKLESVFKSAIGGLVSPLVELQKAARRLQLAMSNPALSAIDPVTAAYLPRSLGLTPPAEFRVDAATASQLFAALPDDAQDAYGEVQSSLKEFMARLCSVAPMLQAAAAGDAGAIAVAPLPLDKRASTSAGVGARLLQASSATSAGLSLAAVQGVLGNASVVIARMRSFIELLIDGPNSIGKLTRLVTDKLAPAIASVQDVADKLINPQLLSARATLERGLDATTLALSVLSRGGVDAIMNQFVDRGMDQLTSMSPFLRNVSATFNDAGALLDVGFARLEPFIMKVRRLRARHWP